MGVCEKEHLRHPHVPSLSDLAGQVPGQSLCVGPYSRSLAAVRFAALLTTRSGRKSHSVTRSRRLRSEGGTERSFSCLHAWDFGRATLFSFGLAISIGGKA